MVPGKRYTAADIGRILVRRRWFVLLPFAVGLMAMPLIAPFVKARYRSETLILVVPQRVPDSYVKSTVTESIEARLPSISEQILSRSRLERIITDLDLYKKERSREVMEDVVRQMRSDITVSPALKTMDSFRVSYVNFDPKTARAVTERLAGLYIDQNLKDRETQAESTNQFIDAQLQDAKVRLLEQEKKLETYRRSHAGQLPSQLQGNLQSMQNAQLQLQAINETMNRARERRLLIERQLTDAQANPMVAAQPLSGATLSDPLVGMSTAQQLEAAEAALAALKLRYTADHPDVLRVQQTVADLKTRLAEESKTGKTTPTTSTTTAERVQQKKVLDLKAELEVIDHQIASSQAEAARLTRAIGQYQGDINALPTRESELVELTRDYSTLQMAYSTLLMKREESKIAANLERQQIGEQFRVLDPASLPEKPFNNSQRIGMLFSGAIAGLVLGLALVVVLELRDSSFTTEADVTRVIKLPVLALVPDITTDAQRRALSRRRLLFDVVGVGVLVATTAVLAVWRFKF